MTVFMPKPHIVGVRVGKEKQVSLKEYSQATTQIDMCTHMHTQSPRRRGKKSASRIAAVYYLGCPIKKKKMPWEETEVGLIHRRKPVCVSCEQVRYQIE